MNNANFFIVLILTVALWNCKIDGYESPAKKTGIKSIQEHRLQHDKEGKTKEGQSFKKYDERGNEVYLKTITNDGKAFFVNKTFNEKNQNVLNEGQDINGDNYKKVMKYDDEKLIKTEFYIADKLSTSTVVEKASNGTFKEIKTDHTAEKIQSIKEYDQHENLIKESIYQKKDTIYKTCTYDANANLIEEVKVSKFRPRSVRSTYTYNDKNLMVEQSNYEFDGKLESKTIYKYRSDETFEEVMKENSHGVKDRHKYDENGLKVEHAYSRDGNNWQVLEVREYNRQGDQIKRVSFTKEGDLLKDRSFEYKYDDKGNWIEKIKKYGDRISMTTKRTIEYY